MLNKVIITGRLVADPELRYTPSNKAVATARIASPRDFKNQNGEGYLLVLYHAADTGKDDPHFSRTCLILSEYGSEIHTQAVSDQYLEEHSRILIKDNALQTLHS